MSIRNFLSSAQQEFTTKWTPYSVDVLKDADWMLGSRILSNQEGRLHGGGRQRRGVGILGRFRATGAEGGERGLAEMRAATAASEGIRCGRRKEERLNGGMRGGRPFESGTGRGEGRGVLRKVGVLPTVSAPEG